MQGKGLGEFHDIHKLTMFADYRVPVVLRQLGILEYSQALASKVGRIIFGKVDGCIANAAKHRLLSLAE